MTITDEMVAVSCDAFLLNPDPPLSKRMRAALEAVAPALIAQGMTDALSIARRTLIWSADQEAKFVDALRDAGMP